MIISYLPAGSGGKGLAPVAPYANFGIESVSYGDTTIYQIIYVDFSNNPSEEITFPKQTANGDKLYLKYNALSDARSNLGLATRLNIMNDISGDSSTTSTVMTFPNQIKTVAFKEFPINFTYVYATATIGEIRALPILFQYVEEIIVPENTIINTNNFVFYNNVYITDNLSNIFEDLISIKDYYRQSNVLAGILTGATAKNNEQATIYFNNLHTISGSNAFANAKYLNIVLAYEDEVITVPSSGCINVGTGTYFYVPDALLEDYKAAAYWSTKASIIKPISELVV